MSGRGNCYDCEDSYGEWLMFEMLPVVVVLGNLTLVTTDFVSLR